MATKYSYSQLLQLHNSEESFITECIELVYCGYIYKSLQSLENDASRPMSRDKYYLILKKCKEDSKMKQMNLHRDEVYLGKNRFTNQRHPHFMSLWGTLWLLFCPLKVG
jgi:hypothetical protein